MSKQGSNSEPFAQKVTNMLCSRKNKNKIDIELGILSAFHKPGKLKGSVKNIIQYRTTCIKPKLDYLAITKCVQTGIF